MIHVCIPDSTMEITRSQVINILSWFDSQMRCHSRLKVRCYQRNERWGESFGNPAKPVLISNKKIFDSCLSFGIKVFPSVLALDQWSALLSRIQCSYKHSAKNIIISRLSCLEGRDPFSDRFDVMTIPSWREWGYMISKKEMRKKEKKGHST